MRVCKRICYSKFSLSENKAPRINVIETILFYVEKYMKRHNDFQSFNFVKCKRKSFKLNSTIQ